MGKRLVVLGDSISAGVGGSHALARYTAHLCVATVIAEDGWTSRRLLKEVQKQPRHMWKEAEDVLILIGGNDLLWALPYIMSTRLREKMLDKILHEYQQNLQAICALLSPLIRGRLILAGLYNPLPHSDIARQAIMRMNHIIRQTARLYKGCFVDLFSRFEGRQAELIAHFKKGTLSDLRLFGDNPIHPNDRGHQVIAEAIWETCYAQKTKKGGRKRLNKKRQPM